MNRYWLLSILLAGLNIITIYQQNWWGLFFGVVGCACWTALAIREGISH